MLLTVENAKGGTGRCWREKVTNLDLDLWVRVSVGRLAGDAPMLSDVGSRGRVGGASGVRCSSLSSFFGHMLLVCVVQDLSLCGPGPELSHPSNGEAVFILQGRNEDWRKQILTSWHKASTPKCYSITLSDVG